MHTVFKEFKDTNFYWVDSIKEFIQEDNLNYLTKAKFCEEFKI
jgi:hypothetical protein